MYSKCICIWYFWTIVKLQWQLLKRNLRQMGMKLTRKMTFLIGRAKISRLLQFQDLGGQYAPISARICEVRL